jgi:hypothetical protein
MSMNSQQSAVQTQSSHTVIPEIYHLTGMENYGIWAWRMKNVLERDGLFVYCTTLARENMSDA